MLNLNDDSDWALLTSFGIRFLTEEAKANDGSPSNALLCIWALTVWDFSKDHGILMLGLRYWDLSF